MTERRKPFPKRLLLLIGLFVLVFVLAQVAKRVSDSDNGSIDAILIVSDNLPEIPVMRSWPSQYYEALKAAYTGVSDLNGGYLESYEAIGCFYLANGYFAEARQVFGSLLRIDSADPFWNYCFLKSLNDQDSVERLHYLNLTVEASTAYSRAHSMLLEVLVETGEEVQALELAERWVERYPESVFASLGLVNLLFASGRRDEAEKLIGLVDAESSAAAKHVSLLRETFMMTTEEVDRSLNKGVVAYLSTLYRPDLYESRLEAFLYSYVGLSRLALEQKDFGLFEDAQKSLNRLVELYPLEVAKDLRFEAF